MTQKYRAFLDESGQREYNPQTDRYYVVGGVIVREPMIDSYEGELRGLKRLWFGRPTVELKSNWMRQPHERRRRYLDRGGLSERSFTDFTNALYTWLEKTELWLIAGVVDKHQMKKQYKDPHHPSALAYQVFLQRYQKFLEQKNAVGSVTWDQISGASGVGNKWRDLLRRQHRMLLKNGCNYTGLQFSSVKEEIAFRDSAESSLVQLADVFAYNTFRQFKAHGATWDDPNATELDLYDYFARCLPRVHRSSKRVFAGFGVAKVPSKTRHQWLVPVPD